ncbi:DUF6894 family protein [Methylobacterium sp. 092160098-2]|jgi:hypothetical protein|uniref:DUF6894 family protein n=1 Tax=Methylobacterium sp. 092160098-2 TaxID=3025129 RepID=UPI002381987F|nr:hypothetical protein [Methylobacterium sp. 092160098-2]MDE4914746.1 hypothetical protein [Methylobacterium sp. 092160098-2]
MPHFFIDTDDGPLFCRDEECPLYSGLSAAEAIAVRSLREIARDARAPLGGEIRAHVRDETGAIRVTAILWETVERAERWRIS